jgi:GTP-binding protein HflX
VEGLSRAGVGVGARGPGETKLETDRRQIHNRIGVLKEQLNEVAKNRNTQRRARKKEGVQTVALVGYTNAGKSTLLNKLTDAGIFAEDMLFATLDPTARKFTMPDGGEVVFVDTVGFIRKLPHHLIRAFSSTLEESMLCDVILHVIDSSSPEMEAHIQIVDELLESLNKEKRPVLRVYNKLDVGNAPKGDGVRISAKTGKGLGEFLEQVQELLPDKRVRVTAVIPYARGELVAWLHDVALVEKEEYANEGTRIQVMIAERDLAGIKEFIIDN